MSYSQIIAAETYNRLMAQHLYIGASDRAIRDVVLYYAASGPIRLLEVGCGPARITPMLAMVPGVERLVGLDVDPVFVSYARERIHGKLNCEIVLSDILRYSTDTPFDFAVSQGFHHHVAKTDVHEVLVGIRKLLKSGGVYIIGDEFLPSYANEQERCSRAIIWYSHIIAAALHSRYAELATEEAKTLLDDLQVPLKSQAQINLVLNAVTGIDVAARAGEWVSTREAVSVLTTAIAASDSYEPIGTPALDLSRGDYKIDHQRFAAEIEKAGFRIIGVRTFGSMLTIGAMCVYVLSAS